MAATATELTRLRRQLGADSESFPDDEINDIFTEMEATYAGHTRDVVFAAARLQAWRDMMAQAAKEVTYREGAASESLSDIMKNMRSLEASYREMLDAALQDSAKAKASTWWGSMNRKPSRRKEWPDA